MSKHNEQENAQNESDLGANFADDASKEQTKELIPEEEEKEASENTYNVSEE
jgi:hypothetical protein